MRASPRSGFGLDAWCVRHHRAVLVLAGVLLSSVALAQDDAGEDSPKAPAPLPLSKLMEALLTGESEGSSTGTEPSKLQPKDAIDRRAARDTRVGGLWESARQSAKAGDWKATTERLQKILDLPEDSLLENDEQRVQSARLLVNRLLAAAPAETLDAYEIEHGGTARQQLATARHNGDLRQIALVATRYFHTLAGSDAALQLAAAHFDRGEFALADVWFRELAMHRAQPLKTAVWQTQAALAAARNSVSVKPPKITSPDAGDDQSLVLGGESRTKHEWMERLAASAPPIEPVMTESWLQAGGNAARTGCGADATPALLAEWDVPLTTNASLRERLETLLGDIRDSGISAIPVASPVITADRIAYRDLRGVQVLDAATGRPLWHTATSIVPEQLLSSQEASTEASSGQVELNDEYFGDSAQFHPLASWLFRDAATGQISSDGQQLFVLDDVAVLSRFQPGVQWESPDDLTGIGGMAWGTNRLSSYDLRTGRLRWTIGGPPLEDAATSPLAGAYFLSAPTVDAAGLYVIAVKGEQIRLYELDSMTGQPRWSQLLAFADTRIDLDIARRWLGASPSVSEGIVVCPTGVGWLVAVDRTSGQLLWSHRYLARNLDDDDHGVRVIPQIELDDAWGSASPLISRGRVLFASPESSALLCLDLATGRRSWKLERRDESYVLGVREGRVYIVGQSGMAAYSLDRGIVSWTLDWPKETAPSGRGAILESTLAVPLTDATLWTIELATGKVRQKLRQPRGANPLGTIVKLPGRTLSLGVDGCRGFPDRAKLLDRLDSNDADRSQAPSLRLARAELQLLDEQYEAAITTLHDDGTWPEDQQEARLRLERNALEALIESDPVASRERLERLAAESLTPEQQNWVLRQRIASATKAGSSEAVIDALRAAVRETGPEWITVAGHDHRSVRRSAWLRGQFQNVWEKHRDQEDSGLFQFLDQILAETSERPLEDWQAVGQWADFHPSAVRLSWSLADRWSQGHEFARAESELSRWIDHPLPAVAVESRLRLAEIWKRHGLTSDAEQLTGDVLRASAEIVLSDGRSARIFASERGLDPEGLTTVSATATLERNWPIEIRRQSVNSLSSLQEIVPEHAWPYFRDRSLQLEPNEHRLSIRSRESGQVEWLGPLRAGVRNLDTGFVPYRVLGHRVLVLQQNVLQLISPRDRRVIWSRAVDIRGSIDDESASRVIPSPLVNVDSSDDEFNLWLNRNLQNGSLCAANEHYVAVSGPRTVCVLDPRNGQELWKLGAIPPHASVAGTDEVLFVIDYSNDSFRAYRAIDGEPLELPRIQELLSRTLTVRGRDLIVLDPPTGLPLFDLFRGSATLRAVDPVLGTNRWKVAIKPGSEVGVVGTQSVVIVEPPGRGRQATRSVSTVDLVSGVRTTYAPIRVGDVGGGFHALVDSERLYLCVDSGQAGSYNYGDSLPSIHVNGPVFAWDLVTRQLLWQADVSDQNLVVDRFDESPLLVFLTRNLQQQGIANYTMLGLKVIDKVTGQVCHDSSSPTQFNGFYGLEVQAQERSVDLVSFAMRLRFVRVKPRD